MYVIWCLHMLAFSNLARGLCVPDRFLRPEALLSRLGGDHLILRPNMSTMSGWYSRGSCRTSCSSKLRSASSTPPRSLFWGSSCPRGALRWIRRSWRRFRPGPFQRIASNSRGSWALLIFTAVSFRDTAPSLHVRQAQIRLVQGGGPGVPPLDLDARARWRPPQSASSTWSWVGDQ